MSEVAYLIVMFPVSKGNQWAKSRGAMVIGPGVVPQMRVNIAEINALGLKTGRSARYFSEV
jgi:hypothetical protein